MIINSVLLQFGGELMPGSSAVGEIAWSDSFLL